MVKRFSQNKVKATVFIEGFFILGYYAVLCFCNIRIDWKELWLFSGIMVLVLGLISNIYNNIFICLVIMAGTVLMMIFTLNIYVRGPSKYNGNENVVIVLACGFDTRGNLSETARMRLDKALEYKETKSKYVVSGGQSIRGKTEADLMRDYLIENGVEENRIIEEDCSTDTFESLNNLLLV